MRRQEPGAGSLWASPLVGDRAPRGSPAAMEPSAAAESSCVRQVLPRLCRAAGSSAPMISATSSACRLVPVLAKTAAKRVAHGVALEACPLAVFGACRAGVRWRAVLLPPKARTPPGWPRLGRRRRARPASAATARSARRKETRRGQMRWTPDHWGDRGNTVCEPKTAASDPHSTRGLSASLWHGVRRKTAPDVAQRAPHCIQTG
jgi:hypothetical protein